MPYDLMFGNLVHIYQGFKVYTLDFVHCIGFWFYHLFKSIT
jgi:hypothetical protein